MGSLTNRSDLQEIDNEPPQVSIEQGCLCGLDERMRGGY